jgi:hypothetical protein
MILGLWQRAASRCPFRDSSRDVGAGWRHHPIVLTPAQARVALTELREAATASAGRREVGWARLSAALPADLVRIDANARTGWPWGGPPWTALRSDPKDLAEPTGLVAAVASMHPDGRVRQPAVRALSERPGPLPAALLALRSVDHVTQVRDDALVGLEAHASVEEARAALPVLLAVAARERGQAAVSRYAAALTHHNGGLGVMLRLLDSPDRRTRRWAFTSCLDGGLLGVDDLLAAAQDRHDQFIRRAAADVLERQRPADTAALLTLMNGRYVDGRVAALAALSDQDLTDADLRAALLDRSSRVGDTARWRARRRGLDVAGVYRRVLSAGEAGDAAPGLVVAALLGLVWTGDRGDLPLITSRLVDPQPSVRAAAIRALVARTEPGEGAQLVAGLLLDESSRVAVAAARVLAAAAPATTKETEEAAWGSNQPWSRRAAWHIGKARGGWDRVEADLRAAADPDPDVAALGRTSLLNWLRTAAATTWRQPQGAQADRFAALLTPAKLGADVERLVAFHAGLPRPTEPPTETTPNLAKSPGEDPQLQAPRPGRWRWGRRR